MDKEIFEIDQEIDYTGFSEAKSAKVVDKPVDLTAGKWTSVSSKVIFSKKKSSKRK